jgi:hypothetical protein
MNWRKRALIIGVFSVNMRVLSMLDRSGQLRIRKDTGWLIHAGMDRKKHLVVRVLFCEKRVMGFEPTNNGLGSRCLTTWRHPREDTGIIAM